LQVLELGPPVEGGGLSQRHLAGLVLERFPAEQLWPQSQVSLAALVVLEVAADLPSRANQSSRATQVKIQVAG
jgi:hypothetical protein